LQSGATPDFQTGVKAVVIDRTAGRPAWSPATLADVAPSATDAYFPSPPTPELELPEPGDSNAPEPYSQFTRFALPTDAEILNEVETSTTRRTLEELISRIEQLRFAKHDVAAKVRDVVARRCEVLDEYVRLKRAT